MNRTYQNSKNNEKHLLLERANLIEMHKDISFKHKKTKNLVADLLYEKNKKEILLEDKTIEESQKSMLKYDFTLTRRELEKAIQQKEILFKDISILQQRLNRIENEIRQTKPWWLRKFYFIR